MLLKGPDELSKNDELKGDELSGSDCNPLSIIKVMLLLYVVYNKFKQ